MDDKDRQLLQKLKERWINGEIPKEQYEEMRQAVLADSDPSSSNSSFDSRATFQGIGIGSVLRDRYEIIGELGRGGMGVVYKAKDRELDTIVAVKVLGEELARDGRSVRNLMEEAKISMRLAHPHIMRLINFESDDKRKFLIMEYIEGETLEVKLAREGKIAEPALVQIASEICEGLGYAHKQKIIHRDIKPSNIMVTASGEVKIMDFGIARVMKDSMTRVTGRMTTGTLIYMSPEQIEGRDVDGRSDLYSLGIMLYELASGTPPFFQGDITHQHLKVEPNKIEEISVRLNEIILKCLEKDKSKRYSSAVELRAFIVQSMGSASMESDRAIPRAPAAQESDRQEKEWSFRQKKPADSSYQWPGMLSLKVIIPETVRIPGGKFLMGSESNEAYSDEKPIHEVTVSDFWIGRYEVTQEEWVSVMKSNPSFFKTKSRFPVEQVSWNDVQTYIRALNETTRENYRLPTEAEWEYACRAGTVADRYGELDAVAWYIGNSGDKTHPVGKKKENGFGLFDMLGNVWEWCEDRYGPYSEGSAMNPRNPSKSAFRVVRGGAWLYNAQSSRATYRYRFDPAATCNYLGFRIAMG